MRLACIFAPLFPLAARLRSEPDLKGEAVVLVEGNGNAARVVAASRPARRAGVDTGMTLPQARAIVPKLLARARDLESERAAQEAMLEAADAFSPRVEDGGEGVVYLDLEGIPAPSLRKDGEHALGRDLIAAVEKTGLPARAGIASSKLAARVAAGLPESPWVVPAGEEAEFLAPLPLARLSPEIEIAETLERWGLRSIGEFAKLPPGEVESRLGSLGRRLHASARGRDPRPLEPRLPALHLSEGMELEWPLVALEPFLFVGHAALERLAARLDGQGLACRRLELTMTLDPDGCDARAIALPAPTRDVKTLLTLVRLELEARPPGSPVVGFTFAAHPDKPRRAQLALFGPPALSPDRLATTIARLASLLGADRVVSPRAADGHRPERFASTGFEPPPPPEIARPPRAGRGLLAVRVLRPPVALEVVESAAAIATSSGGRPARVQSARDASPEIAGAVRVAAGPWSMEEGWWSDAPAARDYWDVELSEGGLYRLYRDRASRAWFADGVYD
jgi:protein ImuB